MTGKVLIISLSMFFTFSTLIKTEEQSETAKLPFMMVYGEGGYGPRELSLGAGFRWEFLSLGISLSGLAVSNPVSIYPTREIPFPKDYEKYEFPGTTVSFDAGYYYDINEFSIFATAGYYMQSDSIFAKSFEQVSFGSYFRLEELKSSGFCFSLGGQYFIDEKFGVGAGYHTKKGVFVQFGYYWY
jgi:hypothetical protein